MVFIPHPVQLLSAGGATGAGGSAFEEMRGPARAARLPSSGRSSSAVADRRAGVRPSSSIEYCPSRQQGRRVRVDRHRQLVLAGEATDVARDRTRTTPPRRRRGRPAPIRGSTAHRPPHDPDRARRGDVVVVPPGVVSGQPGTKATRPRLHPDAARRSGAARVRTPRALATMSSFASASTSPCGRVLEITRGKRLPHHRTPPWGRADALRLRCESRAAPPGLGRATRGRRMAGQIR